MPQTLTPIAELLDRGVGVADLQASLVAATDVDLEWRNDGNLVLFIDNQDAGARTVTLKAQPDPFGRGGAGVNDEPISIPAGQMGFIPMHTPAMFNSGGLAAATLDATTSTSVGLYRLRKAR